MNMKIIRGTTPTLNFLLPFTAAQVDVLKLTFLQNGKIIFTKTKDDVVLTDLALSTENGFITDENYGDSFNSNDADRDEMVYPDADDDTEDQFCNCEVHLTQEDTLGFEFWPAAEKNIAYSQFRIVGANGEAYASDPLNFRIYGVLLDGKLPEESEEEPGDEAN